MLHAAHDRVGEPTAQQVGVPRASDMLDIAILRGERRHRLHFLQRRDRDLGAGVITATGMAIGKVAGAGLVGGRAP